MKRSLSLSSRTTEPDHLPHELDGNKPGPRRSKRVKHVTGLVPDLEDMVQNSRASGISDVSSRSKSDKSAMKGTKSLRQSKVIRQLGTPHPAPAKWRETYDLITSMRSRELADVDTTGCQLAQEGETDPVARRVSTLVSLMLSSQTKDPVCHAAVKKLRGALGGSITVPAILAADEETISGVIKQVGFHNKKTGYLMKMAQQLRDRHDDDVPKTFGELCDLLGVGHKMASLTLSMAWNIHVDIGVDVHINRITNRLGWHTPTTAKKGQEKQTKLNLESWLPRELWYDINHKFVGFGQTICRPTNPHCHRCDLNSAGLCPSANTSSGMKRKHEAINKNSGGPKIEIGLEVE